MGKKTYEFDRELKLCKRCGGSGVYEHRDGNSTECNLCRGSGMVWRQLTVIVDITPAETEGLEKHDF